MTAAPVSNAADLHAVSVLAPRQEKGLALTPTGLAVIGLLGAAFVGLFYYFFYVQNFQAMTSADWSHTYFVPLITLYLLWVRRAELTALKPEVFWPGVLPIVVGIMCYALFQLDGARNSHMLRGFSMLLCLFGLILLLLGPRVARTMILPISYLVFGVTLAESLMSEITVPLRAIAAEGGFALLTFVGVQAELKGSTIDIYNNGAVCPLDIAEACSGMRMLIAFVALGAAIALIGGKSWWQRILLLMAAIPVALLMNVVRVAALGLLTLIDPKIAQGQSHMMVGYILMVPAFLLYMGIVWALDRIVVEEKAKTTAPKKTKVEWWRPGPVRWSALAAPAVLVAAGLLATSALALPVAIRAMGIHLRKLPINAEGDRQVNAIPTETANWIQVGKDDVSSEEGVEALGTRNYLTRTYIPKVAGKDRGPLNMHMAYYTGGIDAVPHVVERCLVAGGWMIAPGGTKIVPIKLDQSSWRPHSDGTKGYLQARLPNQYSTAPGAYVTLPGNVDGLEMRITEFINPKGGHLFAGYFFIANGGAVSSALELREKAFDIQNDYAFYCKVQLSSPLVSSAEELAQQSSLLLSDLLPEIMRCVPDWQKVETGTYPADNPRRVGAAK